MSRLSRIAFCVLAMTGAVGSVRADVAYAQSKRGSAVCDEFSDSTNWDTGVIPTKTATDVVNGCIFNKDADYTIDLDQSATPNCLHIGQDYRKEDPVRAYNHLTKTRCHLSRDEGDGLPQCLANGECRPDLFSSRWSSCAWPGRSTKGA